MKVLFVKEALLWPRSSGHDVHCFHMMQALQKRGVEVSLLSHERCQREAIEGIKLVSEWTFADLDPDDSPFQLTRLQEKFCSYWGTDRQHIQGIAKLIKDHAYDAVVVVGLNVLPYLALVPQDVCRIWYAADEWLLHHWSQFKWTKPKTWSEIKQGMTKGLYEYAFSSCTDRVWVVSDKDASAAKWIMRQSAIDVIANGVDAEHYGPQASNVDPAMIDSEDLVFWGRLDFGPNLDAIEWFCNYVWIPLRRQRPDIQWTVFGFQAGPAVQSLSETYGFKLVPDLPDIRSAILRHRVVVLPFVSGAGIKNKFLEAAALAKPIIASRRALNGVDLKGGQPCRVAVGDDQWIDQIVELMDDPTKRQRLGANAREWVIENYSWDRAGKLALKSLQTK